MKLEQSFDVDAPLERVWEALIDVERAAPSLPGAAITGRNGDGSYDGTFTIKLGPAAAFYAGRLEMQKVDEASHTATMQAHGTDEGGQGEAKATIVSRLSAADGATRVDVVTDYHITGRLARFGRGELIESISERLLREFAGRLQSSLAAGETADEQPTEEFAAADGQAAPTPTDAAAPPPTDAPGEPPIAQPAPSPEASEPAAEGSAGPLSPNPLPEGTPPTEGLSLGVSVLAERARRNPRPLLAVLAALLLLRSLCRRRR